MYRTHERFVGWKNAERAFITLILLNILIDIDIDFNLS